jgi:geranylgeranyl transferase type-2 subunit alpha
MHNRKKPDHEPTELEKKVLRDKANIYSSLVSVIWEKRRLADHSLDTLTVLNKVLTSNPDFYSLWNFRREILFTLYPDLKTLSDGEKVDLPEAREVELNVTAMAIRKNPKSCKVYSSIYLFSWANIL